MEQSVYEIFSQKRSRAAEKADLHSKEVWARDGRIEEIDKELAETGLKIFAAALSGNENRDQAYAALNARVSALKAEKADRLKKLGLPVDYTDIKYECEICSDTGYVGTKKCVCLKKALIKENYKKSGIGKYLEKQTFDNFDLGFYEFGEERENMANILARVKGYARDFTTSSDSLFFTGTTGLGKTHLSSAIAKAVIEKGYSVAYDSAQNIISAFEKDRFVKESEYRSSEKYLDADLLIIDDLGSEVQSKNSVAIFYTVINTRLIASKPTIVSTNFDPTQLKEQYEDRIVSRLYGEYDVFQFKGKDIRKKKIL